MTLTDIQIKQLKPEVRPNGAKYWIVRFWIQGKEKRKHLGSYPAMSVKESRIKVSEAKTEIFEPQTEKITFGEIAAEWLKNAWPIKKILT